jgi:hypothetical protein
MGMVRVLQVLNGPWKDLRRRVEIEEDAKVYKSSTDSAGVSQRGEDDEAVGY